VKHKNEQIEIQDKEPQEPKPEEIIEVLANDIETVLHISTILNTG